MSAAEVLALAKEARAVSQALRHELGPGSAGPLSVSGVLAEQLVRELGAGAQAGAIEVGGDSPPRLAAALVRVIAGDPTDVDLAFVREADRRGTPVVLVQLWPQADWTRPFVLSPFVVECRAGEGFPLEDIADRIVDAVERSSHLAAAIPALRPSFERKVVLRSVVRAAAFGAFERRRLARALITDEQVRMVGRLSAAKGSGGTQSSDEPIVLAGVTGVVLGSGFALQQVARTARWVVPAPVADVIVAAAGTWALAKAAKVYSSRGSS